MPFKNLNFGYCVWNAERLTGIPAEVTLAISIHEALQYKNGNLVMTDLAREHNNYFGVRCREYDEASCVERAPNVYDQRYEPGVRILYRKFANVCDSVYYITDRIKVGTASDYYRQAMQYTDEPEKMIATLGGNGRGYSTDPEWADKVIAKYEDIKEYISMPA